MSMKVFITGGAGYIGSVAAAHLLDLGHEIVVFDNLEAGHRSALDERAVFIEGDLRDQDSIREALCSTKPDAVMHFAAYALVGESMTDPQKYFRNNVVGGANLLEAMIAADVGRIVFSSTCATYGQPDQVPISESEKQKPANPYGESKLMFEHMLRWHAECRGLNATCLRYFNACGAAGRLGEDHDPESHLIPLVLEVALGQRESITIFGTDYDTEDGTCIRDYIHVSDLATAHAAALELDGFRAFNLGVGRGYSVREVIETVRKITGKDIPVVEGERRAGDPARLIASAGLAADVLSWTPAMPSLEAIVASAWEWHREHPDGYST